MRLVLPIALILAMAGSAFAADHWHRAHSGGQDLTEADGTVVGMVRHRAEGWVGFAAHERGGEDFDTIGDYRTMAEAKAAVAEKMHAADAGDEQ